MYRHRKYGINAIQYFLSCFILVFVSCVENDIIFPHLPIIEIGKSFDGKKAPVKLSQYASDIDYIALETVPESLLPDLFFTALHRIEDRFLIYGKGNYLTPLLFDANGGFIRKVGTFGRALNEIVNINAVFPNYGTNEIVIADIDKFLLYDSQGNYKRSIDVFHNTLGVRAYCLGANAYVYKKRPLVDMRSIPEEHFMFIDSLGNTTAKYAIKRKKFKVRNQTYNSTMCGEDLYSTSNGIVKVSSSNDTICSLESSVGRWSFKPVYKLDFGEYAPGDYIGAKLFLAQSGGFTETEQFISMIVLFPFTGFPDSQFPQIGADYRFSRFIFDKKSGKTYCLPFYEDCGYSGFENDIDGGIPFFPLHHKDGKVYQLVDAAVFIEMAEKCSSEKMKQVASTLTEESNPVLIEVTLK